MALQSDDILAAAERLAWRDEEPAERLYGKLAYHGEAKRWVITELEPQVAIRIKRVFPRISVTQIGSFGFVDSDETRTELEWFLGRYPLQISPLDRERLCNGRLRFERIRRELEQVLNKDWTPSSAPGRLREGVVLRPNQARAVEIAQRMGRLLVADDVSVTSDDSRIKALAKMYLERPE